MEKNFLRKFVNTECVSKGRASTKVMWSKCPLKTLENMIHTPREICQSGADWNRGRHGDMHAQHAETSIFSA